MKQNLWYCFAEALENFVHCAPKLPDWLCRRLVQQIRSLRRKSIERASPSPCTSVGIENPSICCSLNKEGAQKRAGTRNDLIHPFATICVNLYETDSCRLCPLLPILGHALRGFIAQEYCYTKASNMGTPSKSNAERRWMN